MAICQTAVIGTIVDPNANPYAKGSASAIKVVSTGQDPGITVNSPTTLTGSFSMVLPSPFTYQFTICAPPVQIGTLGNPTRKQVCFTTGPISISGASFDITSNLPTIPIIGPGRIGGLLTFIGGPIGTCQLNQRAVDTTTGKAYSCLAGSWILVDAGTTTLASPVTSPSPLSFHTDLAFKGPDAWTDVTRFGVRSMVPTAIPADVGITATINSGSPSAAVSTSSCPSQAGSVCFKNGDGVVIYGAGTAHSLTTPLAPTITPSLAISGTGTGFVTNGPTGSTTYCYRIVARTKSGGLTAAGPETCIANGVTLGVRRTPISTLTRNNDVVTVVTSSPHGFAIGCTVVNCGEVYITGSVDIGSPNFNAFNGWWAVESATDNTHFTFSGAQDTRSGSVPSATQGTAQWFSCNHVTWPQVTGAWEYYIYAGARGAETLYGISRPQGTINIDLSWDDFGSPMMSNFSFPPFVPSTPPASATSDHLVTTIASGAGTTTLALTNTASTSVVGATIRFDNTPNIVVAAAAISSRSNQGTQGGSMYFPLDGSAGNNFYIINSYLNLARPGIANTVPIMQAGQIWLNETVELGIGPRWYGDRILTKGAGASFSAQQNPLITVNTASPGVYVGNANLGATNISALTFSSNVQNGVLMFLGEGQFNYGLDRVNMTTSTSPNDYMGVAVYLRGHAGQSAAFGRFTDLNISAGSTSPTQDGFTHTPALFCNVCGATYMKGIFMAHRNLMFVGISDGGSNLTLDLGYTQGSVAPFLTVSQMFDGMVRLSNVTLDSTIQQLYVDLPAGGISNAQGSLFLNDFPESILGGAGINHLIISGLRVPVTGIISIAGAGFSSNPSRSSSSLISGLTNDGILGLDFNYMVNANQAAVVTGPLYPHFISNATLTAPTCVISAGGSVVPGTYTFRVAPVWWNGSEGIYSLPSNSCTVTGRNQTITVNWHSVPGFPKSYNIYGSSGGGFSQISSGLTTASAVYTTGTPGLGGIVEASVPSGGPTMMMPGVQGIATPALVLPGATGLAATVTSPALPANSTATVILTGITFANLGTPANGNFYYCPDCTIAAICAGGGTGALAKRLNGVWVCN